MLDPNIWSPEAEQSVLGALMLDGNAWDKISGLITETSFFSRRHGYIFSAIKHLAELRQPTDGLTVSERLKTIGLLEEIGGMAYIGEMVKNCAGISNVAAYATVIRDRANLRRLIASVMSCNEILGDTSLSLPERAERASAAILEAADGASEEADLFTLKNGIGELYQKLEADHKRGTGLAGLATGFADLDARMSGMKPGELIIVAARPGKGKTNLALNISGHVSRNGGKVVFFSMEMSKMELASRMASCENNMHAGAVSKMDWEAFSPQLSAFISQCDKYPMLIDDRAGQTMERIRVASKKAKRMLGGLDLIVIDYLQLIRGQGSNRYEQVTNISRDMKILAKDFGVPVLCLAQLNRGNTNRPDSRPRASDLRDSGAIEQDADVVALIHSDDKEDGTTSEFSELIFDKIRGGQRGIDPLLNDFAHCRFRTTTMSALIESRGKPEENTKKGSGYDRA